MHPVDLCPDDAELEQLLLGRIGDEREPALLEHLAGCKACAARASSLNPQDDLVATMRQRSPILEAAVDTPIDWSRVWSLKSHTELSGHIGPYRVERLLGSGGMGVVYLARHEQLGRLVAVKLIARRDGLDQLRRSRFRREAELISGVGHPNVVTLYDIGDWDGVPYFAMEYIAAGTLAERLKQGPLSPRLAANWVEQIARGVAAAHAVGVIHRDLKPANVLLSSNGLGGETIPKVTDFGLARRLDDPQGHTRPGELLGTPSYMAPEQIDPSKVSPAADVYALGAILYETLTGRPPFLGASPLDTLDQARSLDPVPPSRLQPGVSRGLQAITLKCLEKDPARRYASAEALADDLRRWLTGQPILARPDGIGERVWKWARQKPAIAVLVVGSMVGVAILLVVAGLYERSLRQALAQATVEGQRADENYKKARKTLKNILQRTRDRRWNEVPRLQQLKREQVEDALAFFEQIAQQWGDSLQVREDISWAILEMGKVHYSLGRSAQANEALLRADQLTKALLDEYPEQDSIRLLRADVLLSLGALVHGFTPQSASILQESASLLEELLRDRPGLHEARSGLANVLITLGGVYVQLGRFADAQRCLPRAIELYDELLQEEPKNDTYRMARAKARVNLAASYRQSKRGELLRRENDLAEAELERLYTKNPADDDVLRALAVLRINHAYDLQAEGKVDAGLDYLSRNLPMLEQALRREPDSPIHRDALFRTQGTRALLYDGSGRKREALQAWEQTMRFAPPEQIPQLRAQLINLLLDLNETDRVPDELDTLLKEYSSNRYAETWKHLAAEFARHAANAKGKSLQQRFLDAEQKAISRIREIEKDTKPQ